MDRITKGILESQVKRINRLLNRPEAPYTKNADGQYEPRAGCFHLSGAYGGYALHEMSHTPGCSGVNDVFGGHMPKRELYEKMSAFIRGIEAKTDNPNA